MAQINVGTPVTAPITPGREDTNVWPTHIAKYGKGGFEVVDSIQDRDLITDERRENKAVLVRVGADGEPALFEYSNSSWNPIDLGDGISSTNMTFDDGVTSAGGVDTAVVKSMVVEQDPNAGNNVVLTPYTTFSDMRTGSSDEGGNLYDPVRANKVSFLAPLQTFSDPNETYGTVVEIAHDSFEPMQAPGYLAYMDNEVEVYAKKGGSSVHIEGMIYPMDVVVSGDHEAIVPNIAKKAIGIQESDGLDPNISGGSDFLTAYRVSLKGIAPEDGRVLIYLAKGQEFDGSSTIISDINNEVMATEKHYKAGDKLGDLEVVGVLNAKGLTNLTMHVVHDFSTDNVVINERAKGISGIMIQALSDKGKTGKALLQYELDTKQVIEFSRIWLGKARMSFAGVLSKDAPKQVGAAGNGVSLNDGLHFYNPQPAATEIKNGELIISDDGTNICDFSLGKVFNTSETVALHGKQVDVTITLTDSTNGWNLYLLKWTGAANKYTNEMYKSRDGGGMPIWEDGWGVGDVKFISEDVTSGTHAVTKTFTVPSDANNYAIIIAPVEAETPMILRVSNFDLDVVNPFYMYEMYKSVKLDEIHLKESTEYLETAQDNEGLAGVRYTINTAADGLPMPCGVTHKGRADIILDATVNNIVGSSASGGEGALKFMAEGTATVDTTLRIWSEQAKGTSSVITFWWVNIAPNGYMSKIAKSETSFTIPGGSQAVYTMKPFTVSVASGDRIALRASADKADGAFIESTSKDKPMVAVKVNFKELLAGSSDDPFADIDVSQFDKVYSANMIATKVIVNKASMVIPMDIPNNQNLSILNAVKQLDDGTIRPVTKLDWSYSNTNKQLTVSFGETVNLGMITIGIYV